MTVLFLSVVEICLQIRAAISAKNFTGTLIFCSDILFVKWMN